MARIRSIKPEFFLHEGLAELSPLHRLFFVGLWTLADKTGRMEDRPRRIKASVMPWEDCDIDGLLWDLADRGFLVRYEVGGKELVHIPGLTKHQRPHPKELAAGLPGPDDPKSRIRIRPAGTAVSSIPSGTPGKESLVSGKELLVSGKESPNPDPVAAMSSLRLPIDAKPDRRAPDSPGAQLRPEARPALAFYLWAQVQREESHGLAPMTQRDPPGDDEWLETALEVAGSVERLQRAYQAFLGDSYWGGKKRYPWGGFMSQWLEKYLPPAESAPPPELACKACGGAVTGRGGGFCPPCFFAWQDSEEYQIARAGDGGVWETQFDAWVSGRKQVAA